jgi:hypothetical protein
MQEDSTEGGRFKKEISIDNRSYMLLIRDEGGTPEFQVFRVSFYKFDQHSNLIFITVCSVGGRNNLCFQFGKRNEL